MVAMTTCLPWSCVGMGVCVCVSVYFCLKWQAFSTALIREMFVVGANLENKQDFREINDLWNTHECRCVH